jgi:hypothetical protein
MTSAEIEKIIRNSVRSDFCHVPIEVLEIELIWMMRRLKKEIIKIDEIRKMIEERKAK